MQSKTLRRFFVALLAVCFGSLTAHAAEPEAKKDKIKLLVVTGGHGGFDPETFYKLFKDNPEVAFTPCVETKYAEVWNRDDLQDFDAVLLYDMQFELTPAQEAKFHSLFDKGVGLIVLHHGLLSYQKYPEFERIGGGKYLLDNDRTAEKVTPASTYKGDVDIDVAVVDKNHPITAGLSDFTVHDEIYRGVRTTPDINVLMTTEGHPLAWTRTEKNSRVFGTIIGHGCFTDPNFQKMLAQAIHWVGAKDK
jgi:type 1 glutamine amidotransferase